MCRHVSVALATAPALAAVTAGPTAAVSLAAAALAQPAAALSLAAAAVAQPASAVALAASAVALAAAAVALSAAAVTLAATAVSFAPAAVAQPAAAVALPATAVSVAAAAVAQPAAAVALAAASVPLAAASVSVAAAATGPLHSPATGGSSPPDRGTEGRRPCGAFAGVPVTPEPPLTEGEHLAQRFQRHLEQPTMRQLCRTQNLWPEIFGKKGRRGAGRREAGLAIYQKAG